MTEKEEYEYLKHFANFVAYWIFTYQNDVYELDGVFCDVACRKLEKLGMVQRKDGYWYLEKTRLDIHSSDD